MIFKLRISERQVIAIAPGGIEKHRGRKRHFTLQFDQCCVCGGTTCIIKRLTKALRTISFRLHQGVGHRQVETCHPLGAAGHIAESLAAVNRIGKVRYRLLAGSPGRGGPSRLLPVIERASPIAGCLKMVRQEFWVTLDRFGAKLDQGDRDLAVQLGQLVAKKRADGRVLISACLN